MKSIFRCLLVAAFICGASSSFAVTGGVLLNATFGCSSVSLAYDAMSYDRDNTASGSEATAMTITDGVGTQLFEISNVSLVASTSQPVPFIQVPFLTQPQANPITLRLVSLAGNGLPEQIVWNESGMCSALPIPAPVAVAPVPATLHLSDLIVIGGATIGVAWVVTRRRQFKIPSKKLR